jgi:DNA-damage-inducible protein J
MPTQSTVSTRIDESLKIQATAVLADMGLTVSDALRIFLTKVATEQAMPFEMQIPNALTAETLRKSERGEDVHHAEDAEDLFKQLGI